VDRFTYFFSPFAQMESDRSNSQNRVSHAADLSTVLVSSAGQALRPVSSSGGSGCAFTTTEGPRGTEARLHHNTRKLCQLFHPRLLRARRGRPRGRSTAEQRDEVAAPHSITPSAVESNVAGTVSPDILAVSALMTNSTLVDTHPSGSLRSSLRLRVSNR
jgi:hypothetical protein